MFHVEHPGPGRRGDPEGAAGKVFSATRLSALLAGAGISVSCEAAEKLVRHAEEMLLWNRSLRLTAITEPGEVAVKHILDSLLLVHFAPFPGLTLDFGSGAGYPGIPLAIVRPEARLVLMDSSGKKCAFLSHACALLGLRNAEVVQGRLTGKASRPEERFDQIVTRATRPPEDAARLLIPRLAPGGRLLLMTGPSGRAGKGAGDGTGFPLPRGTTWGRQRRFELPGGMGSREIREILSA